jgi:hypothetical protein
MSDLGPDHEKNVIVDVNINKIFGLLGYSKININKMSELCNKFLMENEQKENEKEIKEIFSNYKNFKKDVYKNALKSIHNIKKTVDKKIDELIVHRSYTICNFSVSSSCSSCLVPIDELDPSHWETHNFFSVVLDNIPIIKDWHEKDWYKSDHSYLIKSLESTLENDMNLTNIETKCKKNNVTFTELIEIICAISCIG